MILRRDPAGTFHFAALQGEFARAALARHPEQREDSPENNETMYLVLAPGTPEECLLSRSDAAVYILARIRGPLRAARYLHWLPRSLRDRLYALIARRRYRWFGKYEQCPLPEPEWRNRFLH
jgi:predicted DCC family thiol-disulfide oxidoreductase YuxK